MYFPAPFFGTLHACVAGIALYEKFQTQVFDIVRKAGKRPMVWEDVAASGVNIPRDVIVQPWMCWGFVR
jgi:hypothetical protein